MKFAKNTLIDLANYLDKVDFANGIDYFLKLEKKNIDQETIRNKAIEKFNYKRISEEYFNFYKNI